MNIEDIKINEYGVIKNKEIKLKKGINIIHGNNESGKTTLLSYINNSLYGISKNKENKNILDHQSAIQGAKQQSFHDTTPFLDTMFSSNNL